MSNYLFFALIMILTSSTFGQKYFTRNGATQFSASVESFEPVEANSKSTSAILNSENGEVAAILFIKSFHFKIALMEEHFNENYMESDKFPKATFKGKIINFNQHKLNKEEKEFELLGTISIKGSATNIETKIKLRKNDENILASICFTVNPMSFGIEIPSIVSNKISELVEIKGEYILEQKK